MIKIEFTPNELMALYIAAGNTIEHEDALESVFAGEEKEIEYARKAYSKILKGLNQD